jgi:hypothetical protein
MYVLTSYVTHFHLPTFSCMFISFNNVPSHTHTLAHVAKAMHIQLFHSCGTLLLARIYVWHRYINADVVESKHKMEIPQNLGISAQFIRGTFEDLESQCNATPDTPHAPSIFPDAPPDYLKPDIVDDSDQVDKEFIELFTDVEKISFTTACEDLPKLRKELRKITTPDTNECLIIWRLIDDKVHAQDADEAKQWIKLLFDEDIVYAIQTSLCQLTASMEVIFAQVDYMTCLYWKYF